MILGLTGIWWLALLGTLGIRWHIEDGRARRELARRLKRIIRANNRILRRLRRTRKRRPNG